MSALSPSSSLAGPLMFSVTFLRSSPALGPRLWIPLPAVDLEVSTLSPFGTLAGPLICQAGFPCSASALCPCLGPRLLAAHLVVSGQPPSILVVPLTFLNGRPASPVGREILL